jgi:hypothetical protein
MYWTYLLNSKTNNILTLESINLPINNDLEKLKIGYMELINEGFFTSFEGYDMIFISEYNPDEEPIERKKKFITSTKK